MVSASLCDDAVSRLEGPYSGFSLYRKDTRNFCPHVTTQWISAYVHVVTMRIIIHLF